MPSLARSVCLLFWHRRGDSPASQLAFVIARRALICPRTCSGLLSIGASRPGALVHVVRMMTMPRDVTSSMSVWRAEERRRLEGVPSPDHGRCTVVVLCAGAGRARVHPRLVASVQAHGSAARGRGARRKSRRAARDMGDTTLKCLHSSLPPARMLRRSCLDLPSSTLFRHRFSRRDPLHQLGALKRDSRSGCGASACSASELAESRRARGPRSARSSRPLSCRTGFTPSRAMRRALATARAAGGPSRDRLYGRLDLVPGPRGGLPRGVGGPRSQVERAERRDTTAAAVAGQRIRLDAGHCGAEARQPSRSSRGHPARGRAVVFVA